MDGSISVQYIYKEIATFCSTYFSSKVGTIHNRVQRNDDKGVEEQNDIFFIFYFSTRPFGKTKECILTRNEKDATELYVLDNCDEVLPYVKYLSLSFSIHPFNKFKYCII